MNRKAIILGIKGYRLNYNEISILKKKTPWGIILFSRNIKNINQVQNLTKSIRKIVKDKNYPILIDQEGGRVARLNKIVNLSFFSQEYFGNLFNKDKKNFFYLTKVYINSVCSLLKTLGININTIPALDVRRKTSHNIIGDRSFSSNPKIVSIIGKHFIRLYKNNKIGTVIKHIPGHGLAKSDSHYKLPIINVKKKELIKNDFKVFKNSNSEFAMTAHVKYKSFDKLNPATHSKIVINNIIRKHIKFNGILISDDISMKSLKNSLKENASLALQAGCNLVLHCNSNMREMQELLKIVPKIDKFTKKKTSHFYKFLR